MTVVENPETIYIKPPANASHVIRLGEAFWPLNRSALVILNQDITVPIFRQLWRSYTLKVCGDGGANRLFDLLGDQEREEYLPDYIVGDFDSLRDDVKDWYKERGVGIVLQTTQWATDMDKCLDLIEVHFNCDGRGDKIDLSTIDTFDGIVRLHDSIGEHQQRFIDVAILGAIDGRFDHTIHSISVLLKLPEQHPSLGVTFLTGTDAIVHIPEGVTYINYARFPNFHGQNCGLLPLAGDVSLTTQGFKWDVTNWKSSLKGSVSSSNRFVGATGAIIEADNDIVLSIELNYKQLEKLA